MTQEVGQWQRIITILLGARKTGMMRTPAEHYVEGENDQDLIAKLCRMNDVFV